jgi:hypothetical protein
MVVVVMMVVGVHNDHHLRLRCIRYRKAEDKNQPEQESLHALLWPARSSRSELF